MPVRSRLQQRKAQEAAREHALAMRLAARRPAPPKALDAAAVAFDLARLYPHQVWRDPAKFNRSVRTKDAGRIRLLVADYLFGRYPAARHIRSIWTDDAPLIAARAQSQAAERRFRTAVYLEAVTGGSVHKACTGAFMTKKETHRFLGVSHTDSFAEAIWFTLARSWTDDHGLARRLSVSRIAEEAYADPFWREVLRWFCVNPAPIAQVNDILDFIRNERRANPGWSIRGRTLGSMAQAVDDWHRALNRAKRMGDAKWAGVEIDDAVYLDAGAPRGRRADWRFRQIKTSQDLAEEGTKMRHCVYSYQALCIRGEASIWSLATRAARSAGGTPWNRALTIELRNAEQRIVQIRGYANRAMTPDERWVISRWASDNGLSIASWA